MAVQAFPSALGSGADTSGFRDVSTQVLHVTSLNDNYQDAPEIGTLRWALMQTFPRIIVFDISGWIVMNGMINLGASQSNVYVAGQTAPSGGIGIRGYGQIEGVGCKQVVFRYMRFANEIDKHTPPNPAGSSEKKRHLSLYDNDEGIIDHCTSYFSHNEAFNFWSYNGVQSLGHSITNTIMGEGATASLMGGTEDYITDVGECSAIRNVFVHFSHRYPNFTGQANGESLNNIGYNFRNRVSRVSIGSTVNFEGNYIKEGSASTNTISNRRNIVMDGVSDGTKVYISDNNYYEGRYDGVTLTDKYEMFDVTNPSSHTTSVPRPDSSIWTSATPFSMTRGVRYTPIDNSLLIGELLQDNVNGVGANKSLNADGTFNYVADAKRQQYFDDIINGTNANGVNGGYGNEAGVYDIPDIISVSRPASYDTDGDGIPDIWAAINLPIGKTATDLSPSGYMYIEEFINEVDTSSQSGNTENVLSNNHKSRNKDVLVRYGFIS